ncbi:putative protein likely involved in heavy metal transport (Copper)/detoxification [Flavobacterium psychrophilum]|uniref:DUF3347 domain-containing protein n=1 Tax=Flavobacterium psychrophilum TaxID=96345 RepID=UPI000B7C55DD|nr:DUF3347 domain-containing protein [Flavobacterium psychrophilum]SNB43717.1 putative protein likely involved in heavy metal transport (Copper)/detoxification [Flavobacterium psychrophilum]
MKLISKILVTITVLLSVVVSNAQIKNSVTETVKVYGNCGMCKTKIEKVGSVKKIAKVIWNEDKKMATLTYDAKKTNQDEILKRIALVGYDSDKFLAPDNVYSKLPGCCQYDREVKVSVKKEVVKEDHSNHANHTETTKVEVQEVNQLKPIFDNYFLLKDALVKTDGKAASEKATALLSSITAVKMETLKMDEHMAWMKVFKDLTADAKSISETQDIEKQRNVFNSLSKGVYELIKVSKPTEAVYYQYCPMKKMNWLSKENTIKNPYYGSQMLSCGSVVETIK